MLLLIHLPLRVVLQQQRQAALVADLGDENERGAACAIPGHEQALQPPLRRPVEQQLQAPWASTLGGLQDSWFEVTCLGAGWVRAKTGVVPFRKRGIGEKRQVWSERTDTGQQAGVSKRAREVQARRWGWEALP